jgi:predicted nucleotidyltransferase
MKIIDDLSESEPVKSKTLPFLKQMEVIRSSPLGSYVRSESKVESDLDFLIEFPR